MGPRSEYPQFYLTKQEMYTAARTGPVIAIGVAMVLSGRVTSGETGCPIHSPPDFHGVYCVVEEVRERYERP